jgi:transposase
MAHEVGNAMVCNCGYIMKRVDGGTESNQIFRCPKCGKKAEAASELTLTLAETEMPKGKLLLG